MRRRLSSTIVVRPEEIDDVLVNPGIGFMTFQRFNGDTLNAGLKWTEGLPIVYQDFKGSLKNEHYPDTSLAYFRIYWRYIEPEEGAYRWDLFDNALKTAHSRGQTLLLRIAPYGSSGKSVDEVPDWYRKMMGTESSKIMCAHLPPYNWLDYLTIPAYRWRTDPEDPRYARHFGNMIRAFGKRYDGHPDLESVDLSIVGTWGEGEGSADLSARTREALVNAYLEAFNETPLLMPLTDAKTNGYGLSRKSVGWRVDCLGDLGGFTPKWCQMLDNYPQGIINYGMKDAWQKAPVSFEACWVMKFWKDKGWDIDYIIDQSLKWHISSFNAKSSAVPDEWRPQVDRWLKKMGYRFVLRKFAYQAAISPLGKLNFSTWWENKGVAPCYRKFALTLRLKGSTCTEIFPTDADIRTWSPGDIIYDSHIFVPSHMPAGEYDLDIALLDPQTRKPKIKLAIAGVAADGWHTLGKIKITA